MKKMLCLALIALLCLSAFAEAAEPAPVPGNRLGLATLRQLADRGGNQFVSPVSLAYALSMAAAGAEGETLDELLAALDAGGAEDIAALNERLRAAGLSWANAAFVRDGLPLDPEYAAALEANFSAELFPLDAAERVNVWVAEHTDGLIDHLMDDVDPSLLLMLVNAIVMDAKWLSPFDPEDTWAGDFHAPDGDVQADFMHQTLYASYAEIDGTQMIRLNYAGSGLCMLIALPPEGGLDAALDALAERGLDWFDLPGEYTEVTLSLPKLDLEVSNLLGETLRALGITRAFAEDAQFAGISQQPVKVSDVLQKVRVQVDEEGTRAAAVTAVMVDGCAMPGDEPEPVPMIVDRPFAMVIADMDSGAICFAGAVVNPVG